MSFPVNLHLKSLKKTKEIQHCNIPTSFWIKKIHFVAGISTQLSILPMQQPHNISKYQFENLFRVNMLCDINFFF